MIQVKSYFQLGPNKISVPAERDGGIKFMKERRIEIFLSTSSQWEADEISPTILTLLPFS